METLTDEAGAPCERLLPRWHGGASLDVVARVFPNKRVRRRRSGSRTLGFHQQVAMMETPGWAGLHRDSPPRGCCHDSALITPPPTDDSLVVHVGL